MTNNSVEMPWSYHGRPIKVVDMAGIRIHSKRGHDNQIDNLSGCDTFRAIDSAQVVLDMSKLNRIHLDLLLHSV